MAKEELLEFDGLVTKVLPNGLFDIMLENDVVILGHLSGKLRKNNIRIVEGDRVKIEMSMYDLTKGRISWRY